MYSAATDPYRYLPAVQRLLGDELRNPRLLASLPAQIESYEAQTGQTVDYLLVVGTGRRLPDPQQLS